MKLVDKKTNKTLIEFEGEKTIVYSKFLENEMRHLGIPIPHGLRGVYHGKDCVCLEDEEFQKAFKEIYYLTAIDTTRFKWQN